MVELGVKLVVVVVEVHPPRVVVREDDREEEHAHRRPGLARPHGLDQVLHDLVEGEDGDDGDDPYLEGVQGQVEVHVLVAALSGLVGAWGSRSTSIGAMLAIMYSYRTFEGRIPASVATGFRVDLDIVAVPQFVDEPELESWHQNGSEAG